MQNPAAFEENIDFIMERINRFMDEGSSQDLFQANQRRHFLQSAYRMLNDWRRAKPCQITYRKIYERETKLVEYLSYLAHDVSAGFARVGNPPPDDAYLSPPDDPFGYFTDKNGVVTRVLPWVLDRYWPELQYLPDELKPQPRFRVGDNINSQNTQSLASAMPEASCGDQAPAASDPEPFLTPVATAEVPQLDLMATTALTQTRQVALVAEPLMSELLDMFLAELAQEAGGSREADRDIRPYVELWIHILGDKPVADYSREDARLFCEKVVDVPHQKGLQAKTPIARYEHVREHGWDGLKRLTATTVENRYFTAIKRLYAWAKEAEKFSGRTPKLMVMGRKILGALEKDAFTDAEVEKLFSQPKFCGQQPTNSRDSGPFLNQDYIYWGYVILYLAGMRPGEIAQLEINDIRDFEGILYFDLRPFDPEQGRVALENMKTLKTGNASRLVPIHPLMVELGLLERAQKLTALGHRRLFPDWKWRVLADGKVKHGDALARDWQRRKVDVTQRANVSAYSGRHSMASLLDQLKIPPRDRNRILGHSQPGVAGRYGRKGALPSAVITAFVEHDAPIVRWLREHLVGARDRCEGDRKLIENWAKPNLAKS